MNEFSTLEEMLADFRKRRSLPVEAYYFLRYRVFTAGYHKLNTFLFPRQRWLTKKIPNHWSDKDYLIDVVLFESIVHFWENEKGGESLEYQFHPDAYNGNFGDDDCLKARLLQCRLVHDELKAAYEWAKERPNQMKKFEEMIEFRDGKKPDYAASHVFEQAMQDKDDIAAQAIVKYRRYMWV